MRGKGAASLALFVTLGAGAASSMCGCARAGGEDGPDFDASMSGDATTRGQAAAVLDSEVAPEADAGATQDYDSFAADEFAVVSSDAAPDVFPGYGDGSSSGGSSLAEAGADAAGEAGTDGVEGGTGAPIDAGGADGQGGEAGIGVDAGDAGVLADGAAGEGGPVDGAAGDGASTDAGGLYGVDAATEAGACGGCPAGFSCGAGSYCVSPTGVPAFGHVYVIVMEEQSLTTIQGNSSAAYINSLIATYALAMDYTAPDHPSLPNYIELTSGGAQGVQCDCQPGGTPTCTTGLGGNCDLLFDTCFCPQSAAHIGDQLDTAGIEWREYAEGMGAPCNATGIDAGANFTASHVPFLYYDDVYTAAGRCVARVRDYGDFAADLAGGTYRFSLISPDSCDDMQTNCTGNVVLQGDDWLATNVANILTTSGFQSGGRDVLFIVWDEADVVDPVGGPPPLPLIVVSPLARHVSSAAAYGHYSLLATIEDGLGVPRLGLAASAAPIADVWR